MAILISIVLKGTIAEQMYTGFLINYIFILGLKNPSLYTNYVKIYTIS